MICTCCYQQISSNETQVCYFHWAHLTEAADTLFTLDGPVLLAELYHTISIWHRVKGTHSEPSWWKFCSGQKKVYETFELQFCPNVFGWTEPKDTTWTTRLTDSYSPSAVIVEWVSYQKDLVLDFSTASNHDRSLPRWHVYTIVDVDV